MEFQLSHLIDALPGLVWTALPDGRTEFTNQRWCEYTGLSLKQAVGFGWQSAIHPQDQSRLLDQWRSCLRSATPGEWEARLRRYNGEYRRFLVSTAPITDRSGRVLKWCCINTEIEERLKAEETLRVEKRFLELVAKGVALPIVLEELCRQVEASAPDCYCSILLVNPTRTTFRVGAGPSLPASYNTLFDGKAVDPDDDPCSLAVVSKAAVIAADLANDLERASSCWLMAECGLRSCWSMPILSGDRTVLGLFAIYRREPARPASGEQDIIDRLIHIAGISIERAQADAALSRSAQNLSQARAELTHVTRVMTLGALTASIAHEINQPLSGIITNASTCLRMLAAEPLNLDGARTTVQRILRDGNRASEVIQRLRTLFARRQPNTEPVDLNDAARELLALSSSELQRSRVILRTEFDGGLPTVTGDRVQLQQVILNLILNATDAMREIHDRPRDLFVETAHENANRVRLSVRDTGVGIDPQRVEKLFDAFYTTKATGMGIGLSISRSIIESHAGRLWACANEGPGATFSFSIPCAAQQAVQSSAL